MESDYSFPTGISDIDKEILFRLDVKSIDVVRNTYAYINNLCDKQFWRNKFEYDYVDLGPNVDYEKLFHKIYLLDDIELYSWAKRNNHEKLANFMSNKPIVRQYLLNEKLLRTTYYKNVDYVRKLLDEGADINYKREIIFDAVQSGGRDIVELFLEYGADPDVILYNSALSGDNEDIIDLLIDNGANITKDDNVLLRDAAILGDYDLMYILLEHGADPHAKNDEVLFNAAGSDADYPPLLELLADNGVDIHTQDDKALLVAVENGNLDIVKWLIEHGAKISQSKLSTIKVNVFVKKVLDYLNSL